MSEVNKSIKIENMLIIDIILGIARLYPDDQNDLSTMWGYSDDTNPNVDSNAKSYGSIIVIENNTRIDVVKTMGFTWLEAIFPTNNQFQLEWAVWSYKDDKSYQQGLELFQNKDLYVTVDGVTYNLGKNTYSPPDPNGYYGKYFFGNIYTGDGAQNLGNILKQTGVTKRLYINWK